MANILFVDDEPLTRQLLMQAAQILGHKGITASSKEEALKLANHAKPDLIVTDINLDGSRSLDLIDQLRQMPETKNIPVVTLSALNVGEIETEAAARGAVASLEKPIRLQRLLEVISQFTT